MNRRSVIVITGASGLVGTALVRHFSKNGYFVKALVRDPSQFKATKNTTYFPYDMTRPIDEKVLDGAQYLIHTAYIKKGDDVLNANVRAAKELLEQGKKYGIKKNVFMSSMSADKNAVAVYGRQKYAIEKLFKSKDDAIIRSGLIIGDGGLIKNIVSFMRTKHMAPLVDSGRQPIQTVDVADLSKAMEIIIKRNISGTLLIGTPTVYSYKEFYSIIKKQLRIPAIIVSVPFFIPLTFIRLIHFFKLPLSITEDNLQGLRSMKSYDTAPSLKKLGLSLTELPESLRRYY